MSSIFISTFIQFYFDKIDAQAQIQALQEQFAAEI
jgi:hypothetical protein